MVRLVAVLGAAGALAAPPAWQIAEGDVVVVCPITLGGSFEARTGNLSGSLSAPADGTAAYGGSLSVDLATLDTGIELRNHHLRDRYLEVHRGEGFDRAVLSDVTLADPSVETNGGRTSFTARLLVHGVTQSVEGDAQVSRQGDGLRVQATFPLNLPDFDIESPRYLGVGVRDRVRVRIAFTARALPGDTE